MIMSKPTGIQPSICRLTSLVLFVLSSCIMYRLSDLKIENFDIESVSFDGVSSSTALSSGLFLRRLDSSDSVSSGESLQSTSHNSVGDGPHSSRRKPRAVTPNNVVVIVTSTGGGGGQYLRQRIIPSARTWMAMLPHVYVILEDTFELRYDFRQCNMTENTDVSMTSFTCPGEPTYLLARKCTDDYWGAPGLCCKIDAALYFLTSAESQAAVYRDMKYLIQSDDDMFWRSDQLMRWLNLVERGPHTDLPLCANSEAPGEGSVGVMHVEGCEEIHTNGWYQPIMMNKAAVDRVREGVSKYGITDTCKAFAVSQDIGLGVFFWIHQLYHITMPGINQNVNHYGSSVFHPQQLAVHSIKDDECGGEPKRWSKKLRYDQEVVLGCGKVDFNLPGHNETEMASMYDAYNWYKAHGKDIATGVDQKYEHMSFYNIQTGERTSYPYMNQLQGYETTAHAKQYDVTKEWRAFTVEDCKIKGKFEKTVETDTDKNSDVVSDKDEADSDSSGSDKDEDKDEDTGNSKDTVKENSKGNDKGNSKDTGKGNSKGSNKDENENDSKTDNTERK
jgi:hypothetical protein